jgi:hypothetical protein
MPMSITTKNLLKPKFEAGTQVYVLFLRKNKHQDDYVSIQKLSIREINIDKDKIVYGFEENNLYQREEYIALDQSELLNKVSDYDHPIK